jgi:uncharacterized membrane protein YwaF
MSMETHGFQSGFAWWGPVHIAWLAGIVIFCWAVCFKFRKIGLRDHDTARQDRWLKTAAVVLLSLECLKDILLLSVGAFNIGFLPLHLCGLSIFVYLVYAFSHHGKFRDLTGEVIYTLCLVGTLGALLFPDWTGYWPGSFRCILAFMIHGMLLLFPMMILTSGRHRPWIRRFYAVPVYLAAVSVPVYIFDHIFMTNYMFLLHGTKGTPIASLEASYGAPAYIFIYLGLLLLITVAMYIPWILDDRREGGARRQHLAQRFE